MHWVDWLILVGYVAGVSWLGVRLAGRPRTMNEFFRGGDRLPWPAVSASIIATTISAVTFVGVPAIAYNPAGGNLTYLQLGLIGGLLSRAIVAGVLVPAYYRRRVYSPYDYMEQRLGGGVRAVTTALFSLGGLLAQSARVYLTAMILELVLAVPLQHLQAYTGLPPFAGAVLLIGVIAVAWTLLGGIATVVWTDALLFGVFVIGALAALGLILLRLDGGAAEYLAVGAEFHKFELFNFTSALSLTEPYTLAAAGFAVVIGNVGVYGTDQLLAQRIFCCRSQRDAQKAVLASYLGEAVAALMLLVGVGLFAFYKAHPERLSALGVGLIERENDKVFPLFILAEMPPGITGLVVAGIFAAAISSLTSILAALAQTSLSAAYLPWRGLRLGLTDADAEAIVAADPAEGPRLLRISRWLIVGWGVLLCSGAFAVAAYKDATTVPILDLALGLAGYIVGGLFGAFLLAWLPLNINGRGLRWSAPLSVLMVFAAAFAFRNEAGYALALGSLILLISWIIGVLRTADAALRRRRALQTFWLVLGIGFLFACWCYAYTSHMDVVPREGKQIVIDRLAWPWYAPLGALTATLWGWLLADRRERKMSENAPPSLAV